MASLSTLTLYPNPSPNPNQLSVATHNFGHGLKGFRQNIIDHSSTGELPRGMKVEGATPAQTRRIAR